MQYSVRYINHGYTSSERFATASEALAFGRRSGAQVAIDGPNGCVAGYCPLGGTRWYDETERDPRGVR